MAAVRDRAQLILVGGLSLALVLVAIALVLNSAIYTENLASRTNADASNDAVLFTTDLRHNVEKSIQYANQESMTESDVVAMINTIGNEMAMRAGKQGAAVDFHNADLASVDSGLQFTQTSDTTFESDNGSADYVIATDTKVRDLEMDLDTSTPGTFTVQLVGDSNSLNLVFQVTSSEITVNQEDDGGAVLDSCTESIADGRANVRVSQGTIEGHDCTALNVFSDLSSEYDISVRSGDQVKGKYSFVIDDAADSTSSLSGSTAIYAVTVEYSYQTKYLYYETQIRVAPGETDA
ncbi:hypothetical protein ACFPYI_02735 [Halomarina salina]|uniref:Type IV pilin n=1 Tax=Halomarina salina TaxID=1872699 RepID=A0ABD5RIQ5_9EURY|nr:hypothetical protein [Halomarina salina]